MFHSYLDFDAPSGGELLAELGVRRDTLREVVEDERAIRCPERGAVYPAYGFASLTPEPPLQHGLHEAAPADLPGPFPALPPADWRWRRA